MMKKYLILSDLHGNISAWNAVMDDISGESFDGILLLGDNIDYGMRSNEILSELKKKAEGEWSGKILVNLWGNHEKLAVERDLEHLSTDRGRAMANYTGEHLSEGSFAYMDQEMNQEAREELTLEGLNILAVHGSLEDPYWKGISPDNLRGTYSAYDLVLSGHTHCSQCFTVFYSVEDSEMRNKKAVTFINPGSVGQPRNQNPFAQYAVLTLPLKQVELRAVPYDIEYEQSLFPDTLDPFYKNRLTRGV